MPESRYLTVDIQMTPEQVEEFRKKWTEMTKHGLDPDGPPVPMQPAAAWRPDAEWREITRRVDRDVRDTALISALRFT